jgi:pyridoxamine 5'-phosphate oxidase
MAKSKSLSELYVDKDPFIQFDHWYRERLLLVTTYPDSLSLGTASTDGNVSVRTVLLKEFDSRGFVFFTNYKSRKGRQLSENPNAAMLFYWPESGRQVRIEGRVEKISEEESRIYFNSRPRESRIGAWASNQSSVIPGRDHLDDLVGRFNAEFKGKPIPKPPHWGGFRLFPVMFEFWQEGKFRLHDRLVYTPSKKGWAIKRLAP